MSLNQLKQFFNKLNQYGIPIPLIRDPKTQTGSISLTMVFISFNIILVGLIGKASKLVDGIDIQQAIYWFIICCGLYFGRNLSGDGKSISLDNKNNEEIK